MAVHLPASSRAFAVVGVDPTAGSWADRMASGPKPMASAALVGHGDVLRLSKVAWHRDNADLWSHCHRADARLVAIDGPCATNGLAIAPDWTGWDKAHRGGVRDGERALAAESIGLFWTTFATIDGFDGASRWIARSLRLFSDPGTPQRIEVHPHGAFSVWARHWTGCRLSKKTTPEGRRQRLALLKAFVHDLDGELLPGHDAVDAACAAVVAALHLLGWTRPYGSDEGGGRIWMPDLSRFGRCAPGVPTQDGSSCE